VIAMNSTYAAVAEFAQTWGLLFFVVAFVVVVAYALWPSNKKTFDDAARTPLRKDD
jgi:cytochrome c oxidase cbb3-type subunit IV